MYFADLIVEFLTCHELLPKVVYSGNSAISYLENERVDLIISDIRMENGSGIDLMRWNAQQAERIPFIAMSGDVDSRDETIQFCEIMGISHLAKPFLMKDLLDIIKSTLVHPV